MKIILIFIAFISSFSAALDVERFNSFAPSELAKIKLRSKLADGAVDPKQETGLLTNLRQSINWLGEQEKDFVAAGLIESTLKAIEAELQEIQTYEEILNELKDPKPTEKDYFKSLEQKVQAIFPDSKSNDSKQLEQHEVLSVKKWLLACKYFGKNVIDEGICGKSDDNLRSELSSEAPTAIKILQKVDNGLLKVLAERVKVYNWPIELNIPKIFARLKNKILARFKEDAEIFENVQKEMNETLNKASKDLAALNDTEAKKEIDERMQLVELFLKPESSPSKMTISMYDLRLKAFKKFINSLIERLALGETIEAVKVDCVLKKWLLVNQMMYAADWVTRSGRFVKDWPQGFAIDRYEFPEMEDLGGYFGKNNVKVNEETEAVKTGKTTGKTWKKRLASLVPQRLKSFFSSEKKYTDGYVIVETTEGDKPSGFMPKIFGRSSEAEGSEPKKTIMGRISAMLTTNTKPNEETPKEVDKDKPSIAGRISSFFFKPTETPNADDPKKTETDEQSGNNSGIMSYFRSKPAEKTKAADLKQAETTETSQKTVEKSEMNALIPKTTKPTPPKETETVATPPAADPKPTEEVENKGFFGSIYSKLTGSTKTEEPAPTAPAAKTSGGFFGSFFSSSTEDPNKTKPEKKGGYFW